MNYIVDFPWGMCLINFGSRKIIIISALAET